MIWSLNIIILFSFFKIDKSYVWYWSISQKNDVRTNICHEKFIVPRTLLSNEYRLIILNVLFHDNMEADTRLS